MPLNSSNMDIGDVGRMASAWAPVIQNRLAGQNMQMKQAQMQMMVQQYQQKFARATKDQASYETWVNKIPDPKVQGMMRAMGYEKGREFALKQFAPFTLGQGQTRYMFGGEGPGGVASVKAPTVPQSSDIGSTATFRMPGDDDNQVQGYFDKVNRNWMYRGPQGKQRPVPFGATRVTPSSAGRELLARKDLLKLRGEMSSVESGIRQVGRYMEGVGKTGQGLELLGDLWLGKIKTIFKGTPTEAQLSVMQQRGQLQGLLGRFRKEVVGGGVMTEQDALRILSALGGEPDATRHPEIVRRLLGDIVREKIADYNTTMLPMFNDQAKRGGPYRSRKPLEMPKVFEKKAAGPSQEDLEFTAKKHGISVDEVKRRLGIK